MTKPKYNKKEDVNEVEVPAYNWDKIKNGGIIPRKHLLETTKEMLGDYYYDSEFYELDLSGTTMTDDEGEIYDRHKMQYPSFVRLSRDDLEFLEKWLFERYEANIIQ